MSINTHEVYIQCPGCGQTTVKTDYHENTSSDRGELFCALNMKTFKCQHCGTECDADAVFTAEFGSVEDPARYKNSLERKLKLYCGNSVPFISFSDWDYEITGTPSVTEEPALRRLRAMYPEDEDFKRLADYYRNIRLFGKDYLNKLETRESTITRKLIKMPACLRKVYLHNGVECIGEGAFYGCGALWDIFLPDTVTTVEKEAFCKAGLKRIHVSSRAAFLGPRAFAECYYLTQFFVPDSVTYIGDRCFENCRSLTRIFIPKDAKLGEQVFAGCTALETVELPESLKQDGIREKLGLQDGATICWYE